MTTKRGGWSFAIGIVFIVLGLLAIAEPLVAGLAAALLVGWILTLAGIAHAIAAFRGGIGHAAWQATLSVIYLGGGLYFITHPLVGLGTLTVFLAAILLAQALLEALTYLQARGQSGAGLRLVTAAVTFLLGVMIFRQWPSSSVWAIGTLVGVNLLMTGFQHLTLSGAARLAGHATA
jgi:uncharacterized membrane protein HdeD (DUF308 family)